MSIQEQETALLELITLPLEHFNPRIVDWIEVFEKIEPNQVQTMTLDELKITSQTNSIESICKILVQGYTSGFTLHDHEMSMQIFTLVIQHFLQKNQLLQEQEKRIYSIAFYGRIHQRIETDDFLTALSECNLLCFVNEDFALTYELRAFIYSKMHHDYEASLRDYKKVLQYIPKSDELCWNCGVMLENLERFEEAIEYYEKCVEINSSHENAIQAIISLHEKMGTS